MAGTSVEKEHFPHALYFQVFGLKPGRGEDRRIKIIEAFIHCLAKKGLENTSFETLGKMVKMNRTHVAYYFANRDELIRTAVRYSISMAQQVTIGQIELARNWKDRLRVVVSGPLDWLEANPDHASVLTLFIYLCTYDEAYKQLQNSILDMGEQRILSCIADRPGLTLKQGKALSRAIQAMIAGSIHNYFSANYPTTLRELRETVVRSAIMLVESSIEN